MSNFDEGKINRGDDGKFGPKAHVAVDTDLSSSSDSPLAERLADEMTFYRVVRIGGTISTVEGVSVPIVEDGDIDDDDWEWVEVDQDHMGNSQYVRSPEDYIEGDLADEIADNPGVYVLVPVEDDSGIEGWGVLRQTGVSKVDTWDLEQRINTDLEFDSVHRVTDDGEMMRVSDEYPPEVDSDGNLEPNWEWVTGHSAAEGYDGGVMQSYEFIGSGMAEDIAQHPGVYSRVTVRCDHSDCGNGPDDCDNDRWGVARLRD